MLDYFKDIKNLGLFVKEGPPVPEEEKFDMQAPMIIQKMSLMPAVWGFSFLRKWIHHGKLEKIRMEGLKPPYILICNHNAFYDFYILMTALAPQRGLFPAAVDDFIGRENPFRNIGGVPKRKYTSDLTVVKQCKKAIEMKQIFGIYAEARYSLCGLTEVIPDSVGQLVKLMGVPCVTLNCKGHHIYDPFWGNHVVRPVKPVEATMNQIFTPEEIKEASAEEINARIRQALYNDDFRWQSSKRIKVTYRKRAEGLHKVLYQCPHCMTEYKMNSKDHRIFCEHCGKSWELNYYGELVAENGETEFKYPTDWYKWEREQVKKEVVAGTYHFECDCYVNDLPNSKGFVRLGNAHMVHDMNGFTVEGIRDYDGEPFSMKIQAASQYAVHVEYRYKYGAFRDCIDLNTLKDTWYVFPRNCDFSVTKISLATEEIYNEIWRKRNEERARIRAERAARKAAEQKKAEDEKNEAPAAEVKSEKKTETKPKKNNGAKAAKKPAAKTAAKPAKKPAAAKAKVTAE